MESDKRHRLGLNVSNIQFYIRVGKEGNFKDGVGDLSLNTEQLDDWRTRKN
jgi:hypothetical protein